MYPALRTPYHFYFFLSGTTQIAKFLSSICNHFFNIHIFFIFYLFFTSFDMPGRKHCRVLYSNIRGLHCNLYDLSAVVKLNLPDIVFCVETLVSSRRHSSELRLPGYSYQCVVSTDGRPAARGMSLYVRQGYPCLRKKCYECSCHEVACVRLSAKHMNFYVFAVYRNPGADDSMLDCLLAAMAEVQQSDRKSSFVFVGDFNAHHREWLGSVSETDVHGRSLLDFSTSSGCQQLVAEPTHIHGNPLDLVLTDVTGVVNVLVVPPVGTSDHSSLLLNLTTDQPVIDFTVEKDVYIKRGVDWQAVGTDVESLDWHDVFQHESPVDRMNKLLLDILHRHVRIKRIKLRSRDRPWFCGQCRVLYDEKQAAYHRWQRSRQRFDYEAFVEARDRAQRYFTRAVEQFEARVERRLRETEDPHGWWRTLKESLFGMQQSVPPLLNAGTGVLVSDPARKAEVLMGAFESKQSDRVLDLPPTCYPLPTLRGVAFRSGRVKDLLSKLDSYGGSDSLGFFPLFFKEVANFLAPKLSKVFRILLKRGSFPKCWREANITPLPKGSPSPMGRDWRPISITPVLSKVFEKVIAFKLTSHMIREGLFPDCQFAYRSGRGTCDLLVTLDHVIQSSLDRGAEARVVQIDFSAAFDRVNHVGLLHKLRCAGVGGPILGVIQEFLCSRRHRVSVDGCLGQWSPVVSGVPQGSVLGPILFVLYTADLFDTVKSKVLCYADDTTLVAPIPCSTQRSCVGETMSSDLARISEWCSQWDMKLNPAKTKSLIISRSRTLVPEHPPLLVDGVQIQNEDELLVLGVILDRKLTYERHLRQMASRARQKTGILRKAAKIFSDDNVLARCLRAYVLPLVEYCSPVWSSSAECHLSLLDRVFRVAGDIGGVEINLDHRRRVGSLSLFWKIHSDATHPMHSSLPGPIARRRLTRGAERLHAFALQPARTRTCQYDRVFLNRCVSVWNSLPAWVFSDNISDFKTNINKHFIV